MHTKWADNIIMKIMVDICLFTGSQFMYTSIVNRQPVSEYNNDLLQRGMANNDGDTNILCGIVVA